MYYCRSSQATPVPATASVPQAKPSTHTDTIFLLRACNISLEKTRYRKRAVSFTQVALVEQEELMLNLVKHGDEPVIACLLKTV